MLEIKYLKTDELIPYVNNSRTHSPEQITQVAASIKEFGFTNPILIDEADGIIAGHGRLMAAQKLKLNEVPTIKLIGLSEAQRKAYVIADNKLALNSGWDEKMLKNEINNLKELDFDLSLLGFNDDELKDLSDMVNDIGSDEGENAYTKKVEVPVYEPVGDKPDVKELYDDAKTFDLIDNIKASNLPQEEKDFLMLSAGRHTVLNFELIANYYAHSSKECQELMEESALVIIDFKKALENGYVRLSDEISKQYLTDYPKVESNEV